MNTRDLILCLREGKTVSPKAINVFGSGLGNDTVSDAQAGAFAMAVCLQGLDDDGRVALTLGMRDSGKVLSWDLPGKVVDKHSTGGVGDAVSLILAPLLASVGVFVPMISGRGLGHTGGTLDKLESIPGVRTQFSEEQFRKIVADVGCAIVAPSSDIAPADQRLYAVRDVTGTVRSLDLITSSILAKKLAAGLEALVLDVKTGSGAVTQDIDEARALAKALVTTANGAGCPTSAVITDMSQPLLPSIGNAVELADVMRSFDSKSGPILDVVIELGVKLLEQAKVFYTEQGARDELMKCLEDGRAKEKLGQMILAQGGPKNFADRWEDYLNIAPAFEILAPIDGYVQSMDGTALGEIVVGIGGGRQREDDQIDYSVGLSEISPIGKKLHQGQCMALVHCHDATVAAQVTKLVQKAILIGPGPPQPPPLIIEWISG
jgi:thymidine phosphorylase|tara:strand:+ start:11059 stop:12360 length:1302 start_codon:yes stop_codon:yes gene_type:complete